MAICVSAECGLAAGTAAQPQQAVNTTSSVDKDVNRKRQSSLQINQYTKRKRTCQEDTACSARKLAKEPVGTCKEHPRRKVLLAPCPPPHLNAVAMFHRNGSDRHSNAKDARKKQEAAISELYDTTWAAVTTIKKKLSERPS